METEPSPSRDTNSTPLHNSTVVTTQPSSKHQPPSGPQEDSGSAGSRLSAACAAAAALIPSLTSEIPSTATGGQHGPCSATGAPQDLDPLDEGERKPSAPPDVRKVYMKVDWTEELPKKWKRVLEKALQSWCNNEVKDNWSVKVLRLLDDDRTAEVEITPSTALKDIKTATLTFNPDRHVTVLFEERSDFSSKMNMTDTEPIQSKLMNDEGAAANVPGHSKMTSFLSLSPFHYWYLSQTYSKEMKKIEEDYGVDISAETRLSICAKKDLPAESNRVQKASDVFTDLIQGILCNLKTIEVPQRHMETEIMKYVLNEIPNEDNKMMLNMSANKNLLFSPEKMTSTVENWLNFERGSEPTLVNLNKLHNTETSSSRTLMQNSVSVKMDIKDMQAPVEMDEVHWQLMKTVFEEQISEIQNKYGVQFEVEIVQCSIKVSARSQGAHHINLEPHALRALSHLYQKVVTSAVTCDLTDVSYTETVSSILQSHHGCVALIQRNGSWKLIGLLKHLVPAITDIKRTIGRPVFDEKMKKLLGYPWNLPQTSGFQQEEMKMGAMGGAHGTDLRDGKQNFGLNQSFPNEVKEVDKEKESEDNCSICLDTFKQKKKLKCGHEFCEECLNSSIKSSGTICPLCKKIFGTLKGNQPEGRMDVEHSHYIHLPGFDRCGTITVHYTIPSGIQTDEHPNPGQHYRGTQRIAYLPDNSEGNHVLELLRRAFQQKLIFTVGVSRTTGTDNMVIWNDIHHKTNTFGGPENYGYPDPNYFKRVKEELKAKGIE